MDYKPCKSLYNKDLIGVYRIIVESNGKHKFHFHNAGVGGSSPPITTINSNTPFQGYFFCPTYLPYFPKRTTILLYSV